LKKFRLPENLKLEGNIDEFLLRTYGERLRYEATEDYEKYCSMSVNEKFDYIQEDSHHFMSGPSEEYYENLKSILFPLLMKNLDSATVVMIKNDFLPRDSIALKNFASLKMIAYRYANALPESTKEESSRLLLPVYLMLHEGVFKSQIDVLVTFIVRSGIEFDYFKNKELVKSGENTIAGVKNLPMPRKLDFLKRKGFSEISSVCDTRLRNSIAHLDFEVQSDGTISYFDRNPQKIKSITLDELQTAIDKLSTFCQSFNDILKGVTLEWTIQQYDKMDEKQQARFRSVYDIDILRKSK